MDFIANILLVAGSLGASLYCYALSRRLARFNDLRKGVGGAVAVLSAQVDDLQKALARAEGSAKGSVSTLTEVSTRAETVANRLELILASLHDLPEKSPPPEQRYNAYFDSSDWGRG